MSFFVEIDGKQIEANLGETIVQVAQRAGIEIPRLCNLDASSHRAGCMICAVFEKNRKAFLPSCAAKIQEGMSIDTSSLSVVEFRKETLSLLLAEHKGDCVAPCAKACPFGFNIPRFLEKLNAKDFIGLAKMLENAPPCEECKKSCEIVCRRKFLDEAVKISDLILKYRPQNFTKLEKTSKNSRYIHNFGKPSLEDLKKLAETSNDENRCLQCHCKKEDDCVLRKLADDFGISQPKALKIKTFDRVRANGIVFEKAKCVLCANCASLGGFAIRGRSSKATPDKPQSRTWASVLTKEHIKNCPTGAISYDLENE